MRAPGINRAATSWKTAPTPFTADLTIKRRANDPRHHLPLRQISEHAVIAITPTSRPKL